MRKSFNKWLVLKENTLWERHKNLPSIFMSTYYALPTSKQLDEFQNYPDLSVDDVVQGFSYTIVGRGVSSPEALIKAKENARIKLEKWQKGVLFP